jgi:hypothetical protein
MNIRRENGLINPTRSNRGLMGVFAVAAISVLAAAPARATIIATDDVEALNYTGAGPAAFAANSGDLGLTSVVGTKHVRASSSSTGAQSGTIHFTTGFGASTLIAAGTYTLTVYAGQCSIRRSYATFAPRLETTGGTELPGKNVLTPYVEPSPQGVGVWVQTQVQYVVPAGHALIGQEFTWEADWTHASGAQLAHAFDAASVDFAPLAPEIGIVNTPPIDFGPVLLNMTNDVTVTVTNSGSAVLNITNFTFSGTDAARFSVLSPTGSVAAAASTNIALRYVAGPIVSNETATLHIWSDDTSANPTNIALVGQAIAGDITPPTLAPGGFVDDRSGDAVRTNVVVTYTVTFSEAMDPATVTSNDFGNASNATITVGTVVQTGNPAVFEVPVTATSGGTLRLQVNAGAVLEDLFNNALVTTAAILDDTTITVDPDAPTIVPPTAPADDATDVATTTNLVAIFSENIVVGSGNIVITNLTDGTATTIDVTVGPPQVTVSGTTLTIDPTDNLFGGKEYAILIDAGAVTDDPAGNAFAGITSPTVWNFTTKPVVLLAFYPFDTGTQFADASGNHDLFASSGTPVITTTVGEYKFGGGAAYFDGSSTLDVTGGYKFTFGSSDAWSLSFWHKRPSGDHYPFRDSGGNTRIWLRVSGSQNYVYISFDPGGNIDIGNSAGDYGFYRHWVFIAHGDGTLTVYKNGALHEGNPKTIGSGTAAHINQFGSGAASSIDDLAIFDGALSAAQVADLYNNGVAADWGTPDIGIVDSPPIDFGSIPVNTTNQVTVTVTNAGVGVLNITNFTFSGTDTARFSVLGSPGSVAAGGSTNIALRYVAGPVASNETATLHIWSDDTSANPTNIALVGAAASSDTEAPTLAPSGFVDDKSPNAVSTNVLVTYTVTFSEAMNAATVTNGAFGNAGSAAITVGTVVPTGNAAIFTVPVTATSGGTLRLQVNAGAVLEDQFTNPLDTASAIEDDTTITVDVTAPTIVPPTAPADEATDVVVVTNFVATFSETIVVGSGNIVITNLTDGTATTIAVTDGTQVTVSGTTLTIDPTYALVAGKQYAILIDSGAVVDDPAGNPFAGITSTSGWNFTTKPVALLAYYPFDTDFTDASGTNDLVISSGTPVITSTVGMWKYGNGAAYFNGSSSLNVTGGYTFSFSATDPWSVSLWVRRDALADSTVISGSSSVLWLRQSNYVYFRAEGGSNVDIDGGTGPLAGVYQHWVLVADGDGKLTMYSNNVKKYGPNNPGGYGTPFTISYVGSGSASAIDDLAIFDGPLTPAQVAELYTTGLDLDVWLPQTATVFMFR